MGIPLKQLRRQINSRDFALYLAYSQVEPFGPQIDDVHAGRLLCLLANINRDTKTKALPYDLHDFLLSDLPKPKPTLPTNRQLKAKFDAFVKQWRY